MNHKLEDYYHTRRDTYDNMNKEGLAGCFAVSVKALEMFDNGAKAVSLYISYKRERLFRLVQAFPFSLSKFILDKGN